MSADNWTHCPKCTATLSIPDALYFPLEPTFREDYEFYGAETGTLTISYKGYCLACGFHAEYNREHTLYPVR